MGGGKASDHYLFRGWDGGRDKAEMTVPGCHYHLSKICLISPLEKAGPWAKVLGPGLETALWRGPVADGLSCPLLEEPEKGIPESLST